MTTNFPPEQRTKETETATADGAPPKLADGVELIGEYEDSGYKNPPSIARRADGQVVQLPQILYVVAEAIDGKRGYAEIAELVSHAVGRQIAPEDLKFLVDEKLRPLGVVAQPDGSSPEVQKVDPMLALKFRAALVPERVVHALTTGFYPFFFPPVILAIVAGVIAFDIWFFLFHGVTQSARSLVYNPLLIFMVLGLVVLATALHEIGHATAARYGGAKPGVMGAGIYVIWPAFYTDVTDAYRLDRRGRLRTDLGGIYFNGLFILLTAGAYFLTSFEPLLVVALVQHFQIMQQLLPFLRLDGYYILSDLTGVPDLFQRLRPTLRSLIPWKKDEQASELKPWVRGVVTAWVITVIPLLLFVFGMIVFNAPRIFATAWDSFFVHLDQAENRFGDGKTGSGLVSSMQMITLALPAVGIALASSRAGTTAFRGAWRWSEDRPERRLAVVTTAAALVALLGFVWWPNGEYKPIQRTERGTVQGGIAQLASLLTGRPGLSEERERELGGATFERDEPAQEEPTEPGSTSPTETLTSPIDTSITETSITETSITETSITETSITETTTTP
jgi:putative peptide zinc metalloprotease protein